MHGFFDFRTACICFEVFQDHEPTKIYNTCLKHRNVSHMCFGVSVVHTCMHKMYARNKSSLSEVHLNLSGHKCLETDSGSMNLITG